MSTPPRPPLLPPTRVAVINQKGGQGKTTTALALAAEMAALGWSSRVVDCDPQDGSATYWLPPQWDEVPPRERFDLSHVLLDEVSLDQATWPTTVPGLSIVPSYLPLGKFDIARPPGADTLLRDMLDDASQHDITTLDCPPHLGQLTVTSVAAADHVIVPVRPGGLDMAGVAELNRNLRVIRKRLNPALEVVAVVVCGRLQSALTLSIEQQLRKDYPGAVHCSIRHTVRVSEASTFHLPLHQHAPECTARQDYCGLALALTGVQAREVEQ